VSNVKQRQNTVHDEKQSTCPSPITEDWTEKHIMTNRSFTLDEIGDKFPQIYCSLILEIVTKHLHYIYIYKRKEKKKKKKRKSERCVSRMLTEEHKSRCMGAALTFLECYHQVGDNYLDHKVIVTRDETQVSHINPES
jgi:hypothetical protein